MKSRNAWTVALCAVIILGAGCHRVSPEEKTLAQKMFNWGIDVSSSELAQVKKPSTFFPFVMGLSLLSEGKYGPAHEQFAQLSQKYSDSKVAAYYAALSKLGARHKVALPQLVHDFNEQLFESKDISYFYGKPDDAAKDYDMRDPMFSKFKDEVLLKEAPADSTGLSQGVEKWFGSLKEKRPYDYIIYSMFSANREESTRNLREGLERYPDSRPLIERFVTLAFRTKDKEKQGEARALIDKLASDPYFALLKVAATCEENQAEWVEHWGQSLRSPLCPEQVKLMESIRWDKLSEGASAEDELRKYYSENVAPKLQTQFDAARLIRASTASTALDLYDLAGRISASAFEAYKKKDYERAAQYLSWNKYIYRALGEKGHQTFLSKMIQLSIAEAMFKGMRDISAARGAGDEEKDYAEKYEKAKHLIEFYTDCVKTGPYMHTAGLPRMMAYEDFEAERPLWPDRVFAENPKTH